MRTWACLLAIPCGWGCPWLLSFSSFVIDLRGNSSYEHGLILFLLVALSINAYRRHRSWIRTVSSSHQQSFCPQRTSFSGRDGQVQLLVGAFYLFYRSGKSFIFGRRSLGVRSDAQYIIFEVFVKTHTGSEWQMLWSFKCDILNLKFRVIPLNLMLWTIRHGSYYGGIDCIPHLDGHIVSLWSSLACMCYMYIMIYKPICINAISVHD